MPASRAIVRQLQRARVAGGVTALSNTMRTASGGNDGLRPRPGASSSPARRWARKRWHQSFTVTRDTPSWAAICPCVTPSARSPLAVPHRDRRCPHSAFQFLPFGSRQYDLAADDQPLASRAKRAGEG